jgi:hypothetical protein
MPFQVSPGVNVTEIDLTTVVPAVSTTEGALAGVFRWGPVEKRTLVDSEANLAARFGKPTNHNAETFFTAANFLSYGNKLHVVRVANTTSADANVVVRNAVANVAAITDMNSFIIKNSDHKESVSLTADTDALYVAKYPGALGNSLKISVCDSSNAYSSNVNFGDYTGGSYLINATSSAIEANIGSANVTLRMIPGTGTLAQANSTAAVVLNLLTVGDYIQVGNSTIGIQNMKIVAIGDPAYANSTGGTTSNTEARAIIQCESVYTLSQNASSNTFTRKWEYFNAVDAAPGVSTYQATFGANTSAVDELHAVVVDENGLFTGVPGTILEVFNGVSRSSDAKTQDGSTNFYETVVNQTSNYVWFANARTGAASSNSASVASSSNAKPMTLSFQGGTDGSDEANAGLGSLLLGYDMFASAEDVDVSLILTGKSRGGTNGEQLANYLIDNIAEVRKDCVVFCSPEKDDVVNNAGDESTDIVAFRNSLRSTSYAVTDSGYKYQYDKYNDMYRWIPLNGDIAGLCVRTDDTRDAWWSPAGFNRGQIKNIVKLAYNPRKADRDILYKAGVNPVVTFPGQGTILYGDKTLLAKPSAFDRINVRRLFIVLEKAIATAAKFTLFEFNDDFTRAQFRNLVEPFLRDVQGRRGIYDFKVVCDTTNNTGEVIDRNEFIGDIYIKPAKSINFIQLNFIAVRTGVEFSEIVGQF